MMATLRSRGAEVPELPKACLPRVRQLCSFCQKKPGTKSVRIEGETLPICTGCKKESDANEKLADAEG